MIEQEATKFHGMFSLLSEDICSGVICQNGGTCVNRSQSFWWCECENGWTGRHCEHNGNWT